MKLHPPRLAGGGVHLNKALRYKVSSHRENSDHRFKEANLWYYMVCFLWKLQLIIAFGKFVLYPLICFPIVYVQSRLYYFGDALGLGACLLFSPKWVFGYDHNTIIAHPPIRRFFSKSKLGPYVKLENVNIFENIYRICTWFYFQILRFQNLEFTKYPRIPQTIVFFF